MPPRHPHRDSRTFEQTRRRGDPGATRGAGLSQEPPGNEAGSGRTYVSEIQRGKRSPTLRLLFKLAPHLGLKPSEIVRRVEDDALTTEHLRTSGR